MYNIITEETLNKWWKEAEKLINMEKSTGVIIIYNNKYRITVKRFKDGIINESICHDDKFDHSDVYGYRFNWNLIPNFREMSVKDIRKEIEKHFINYITSIMD